MKKTYFFDLDGTLLPMDQDQFVRSYFSRLAMKMAGKIDPKQLVETIWKGTAAMVGNDGSSTNERVFWQVFDVSTGLHHETLEEDSTTTATNSMKRSKPARRHRWRIRL